MSMASYAEFEIEGRIGKIVPGNGVVALDIAANYSRKNDKTGEWTEETFWNRVSVFREALRKAVDEASIGDLVKVRGRMRDNRYEKNGETIYTTDRYVDKFAIITPVGERAA